MTRDTRPPFGILAGRDPVELFGGLPSPCYVISEEKLRRNGEIMTGVRERCGAKMLLAQKAFSNYGLYPVLAPYLDGTEASGLYEARLGREEMPGEVHVFSAGYTGEEFAEVLQYADCVVFNSVAQLAKFAPAAKAAGKSVGLRVNPECSTIGADHALYDPCSPGSRLGVTREQWNGNMTNALLPLIDGLHFHTLCEQDADDLETTLAAFDEKFGDVAPAMKWLNFGGGHHITRPGYNIPLLEECVTRARERYGAEVYLEPGEAWALDAGFAVSRVLDIVENGFTRTAVLDISAACHMPDVLEMPYTPPVYGAGDPDDTPYRYRLAGRTCLEGDVMGDYSFPEPLNPGDTVIFGDMAIYSVCKNNTFNGMPLPAVFAMTEGGDFRRLASFGYRDFKTRLGN